ncbi:hypothetical protein Hamer_G026684, partial [Homarus americanus]
GMDGGVKVWLDKVWSKRPGGLLPKNSLLVWDQFSAHTTENTKRLAKGLNTQLALSLSLSKKCGMSNAMDGTEDNLLYETDSSVDDDDDSSSHDDSELGDEPNSEDFSGFEDE